MSEYDLVCDECKHPLTSEDAVVSWTTTSDGAERGFALTHAGHVPAAATHRAEGRAVVHPNGYLTFVGERMGKRIDDPVPLRAILWALAPFVMRHDNPAEMDSMRAASFGERPGVKPGTKPSALAAAAEEKHEGGK